MEGCAPDWSGLPPELFTKIAECVFIEDFSAFGCVCSSWRSAAAAVTTKSTAVGTPLLMLAGDDYREFYSLSKKKVWLRVDLPEAKGKRCFGAGFGWIVTVAESGKTSLLTPISRALIPLPNLKTFPLFSDSYYAWHFDCIHRMVLSENPNSNTKTFVLAVVLSKNLGFFRSGDNKWSEIIKFDPELEETCPVSSFLNIGYYGRKFYGVDQLNTIWVWDPRATTDEPKGEKVLTVDPERTDSGWPYLVESSDGELVLIERYGRFSIGEDAFHYAYRFRVFKIDVVNRKWEEMSDLGGDAVFVGQNAGAAVRASSHCGVRANYIYFTDGCFWGFHYFEKMVREGGPRDMGIYNVQNRSIDRFRVESPGDICPPLWII